MNKRELELQQIQLIKDMNEKLDRILKAVEAKKKKEKK